MTSQPKRKKSSRKRSPARLLGHYSFNSWYAGVLAGAFVLVGGIMLALFSHADSCTMSAELVPTCGALWGAYVPGYNLTSLEAKVGRKFDVFQEYNDFSTGTNGQIPNSLDLPLINGGRILLSTWQPRVFSSGTNYSWSEIASGSLDASVIIPQAKRIQAISPSKIFLAFDSEMDDASTHSTSAYGTPAQYVAAYRHIHDVFAAQGVTNVVWVWTPTGYSGAYGTLASFYPGDSYVDWMGYDPYNFYSCNGNTTWKSTATTFGTYYNWVSAGNLGSVAASKPMILDEYGSHDNPANTTENEGWYESIPATLATMPRLKALSEFDSVGICDSRVDGPDTQAATLTGFIAAGHNAIFNQVSPTVTPTPSPTPTPVATRTPTPSPTSKPVATPTPTSAPKPTSVVTPAQSPTPSATPIIVAGPGSGGGSIPVVSGNISITPSLPSSDTKNLQYFVDGKSVSSGVVDTNNLANGNHTIETKTTTPSGRTIIQKTTIMVRNHKSLSQMLVEGFSGHKTTLSLAALVIIIGVIVWYANYRFDLLKRWRSRL
jgi:hypothetical protein